MNTKEAAVSALTDRIQGFPALPSVVSRVIELSSDPECAIDEFLNVIRLDLSLTAAILKLANSAFYGQARTVSSLRQAVPLLGFNEIRNMVIARAMFSSFKAVKLEHWFDIRGFWVHSFLCGLAARVLARETEPADDAFISGLIHDIGKLVILSVFPSQFARIAARQDEPAFNMYRREENLFGASHGEIGLNLLKRWSFPKKLVDAVGCHHQPETAGANAPASALIYFADMVAHLGDRPPGPETHQDLREFLFNPRNTERAGLADIPWNEEALEAYLVGMTQLKGQSMDLFSLFFS